MNPGTLSEEERYLSAHIADMQRLAVKSGVPRFSMFLNEREAAVARYAVRESLLSSAATTARQELSAECWKARTRRKCPWRTCSQWGR